MHADRSRSSETALCSLCSQRPESRVSESEYSRCVTLSRLADGVVRSQLSLPTPLEPGSDLCAAAVCVDLEVDLVAAIVVCPTFFDQSLRLVHQ